MFYSNNFKAPSRFRTLWPLGIVLSHQSYWLTLTSKGACTSFSNEIKKSRHIVRGIMSILQKNWHAEWVHRGCSGTLRLKIRLAPESVYLVDPHNKLWSHLPIVGLVTRCHESERKASQPSSLSRRWHFKKVQMCSCSARKASWPKLVPVVSKATVLWLLASLLFNNATNQNQGTDCW